MKSNKCPNCGAPLPHMVEGVNYNCNYCGSAVTPTTLSPFVQNTLDKITGVKAAMDKPVYAPGRYAAVAGAKMLMFLVSACTVGAFIPPLGVVMLIGSIVSIFKAVYWAIKWRIKVRAQANFSVEQLAADRQAIEAYFAEQNKAGEIAVKWLWAIGICIAIIFTAFQLRGPISDNVLGPIIGIAIIVAIICFLAAYMKALVWVKDPKEEELSI